MAGTLDNWLCAKINESKFFKPMSIERGNEYIRIHCVVNIALKIDGEKIEFNLQILNIKEENDSGTEINIRISLNHLSNPFKRIGTNS